MKKIVFLFLMALMMSGCVSGGRNPWTGELVGLQKGEITSPIIIEGHTYIARVLDHDIVAEVKYESYSSLKADLMRKSKNELWDNDRLEKRLEELDDMSGRGQFVITGYDYTIDAASHGYLGAALIQDGKVLEKSIMHGIANTPSRYGVGRNMWWNLTILNRGVKDLDLTRPFEVRVISTLTGKITQYIYDDQNAGKDI